MLVLAKTTILTIYVVVEADVVQSLVMQSKRYVETRASVNIWTSIFEP